MITFNISGFLSDFADGHNQIKVDASPATVRDALTHLWTLHVGLRDRVINEQGHVRQHVNIFVDAENIRMREALDTPLSTNSEITILPAVSGGAEPRTLASG